MAPAKVDIVMFNMSAYAEWQAGISNRNFHILHTLLKDPRVRKIVAVDYLPFTFKRAARQWWQYVLRGVGGKVLGRGLMHKLVALSEAEIERTGYALAGYAPQQVPHKLFILSDIASAWSEAKVYARLRHYAKLLDLKNVVIWSYLPTFVGYFGGLGERLSVFDAVDNWLEHSSYARIRERLRLNYQTIRYKADLIFTTSEDLVKFFDRTSGCSFIPNGINLEQVVSAPRLVGRDIANLPRPIIGYNGTLQENRLDVDLLAFLAKANPTKSFVLIGPVWPGLRRVVEKKLKPLPNVHFLGRKSYLETQAYIREYAVAIVPHLENEFNRHTNPLKVYEYLAAGKPIVATPSPALDTLREVVHIAATPEAFNEQLMRALEETSEDLTAQRQAVAQANAWTTRVNGMLEQVFKQLAG